jgi:hypothetical protein
MKALVVYESMYGNTRHIAEAIAEGLRCSIPAEVVLAHDAGALDLDGVELVVAGAPTHAWGLSRRRTREGAAVDATKHPDHLLESLATKTGVREWLHDLARHSGVRGAAFDTRLDKPKVVTGSAARAIQRGLHRAGVSVIAKPQSFVVTGMAGPLGSGEIERANQWGEELGRIIAQVTETHVTRETSAR